MTVARLGIWSWVLVMLMGVSSASFAKEAADPKPLIVAAMPIEPFIVHNHDGTWSGISIELFRLVASDLKLAYTLREATHEEMKHPEKTNYDVFISYDITERRERQMDLTHAFYSTGLAISARAEKKDAFVAVWEKLHTSKFYKSVGVLLFLLFVMGLIVWRLERHRKPDEFGGHPVTGIASGFFWALESMVGKASELSRTKAGRGVTLVWTLVTLLLASAITARLSAELTLHQLKTTVSGLTDLPKVKVGVSKVSAAKNYLDNHGIHNVVYDDVVGALAALDRGEVDAVVDEKPILKYQTHKMHREKLVVLPGSFENHGYGFGLQHGSPLRKPINLAMLRIVESHEWKSILSSYLGDAK